MSKADVKFKRLKDDPQRSLDCLVSPVGYLIPRSISFLSLFAYNFFYVLDYEFVVSSNPSHAMMFTSGKCMNPFSSQLLVK